MRDEIARLREKLATSGRTGGTSKDDVLQMEVKHLICLKLCGVGLCFLEIVNLGESWKLPVVTPKVGKKQTQKLS